VVVSRLDLGEIAKKLVVATGIDLGQLREELLLTPSGFF
jgi:hypothetical protein